MFNFYVLKFWKGIGWVKGCCFFVPQLLSAYMINYEGYRQNVNHLMDFQEDRSLHELQQAHQPLMYMRRNRPCQYPVECTKFDKLPISFEESVVKYKKGLCSWRKLGLLYLLKTSFSREQDRVFLESFLDISILSILILHFLGNCQCVPRLIKRVYPLSGSCRKRPNMRVFNILACSVIFYDNADDSIDVTENIQIDQNYTQQGVEVVNNYSKLLISYALGKGRKFFDQYPTVLRNLIIRFVGGDNFFSAMILGILFQKRGSLARAFQVVCLYRPEESETKLQLAQDYSVFSCFPNPNVTSFFPSIFFLIAPQFFFKNYHAINSAIILGSIPSGYRLSKNYINPDKYYSKNKKRNRLALKKDVAIEEDIDLKSMEDVD